MVTDTGKTIENPKEYLAKKAEEFSEYIRKGGRLYCTTEQVCPECGAVLYDSPCFHFFTDCPRCGFHKEPIWKSAPFIKNFNFEVTNIAGDGVGFYGTTNNSITLLTPQSADELNFKYQG